MGDDEQIKDIIPSERLVEQTRKAFLEGAIIDPDEGSNTYDLDAEFAKTKKNKDWRLYIVLVMFFLVFAVGGFFVYRFMSDKNRNIPVHIEYFEELRLRELLDASKKNENELNNAKEALQALEEERDSQIALLQKKLDQAVNLLKDEGYSRSEFNRRKQKLIDDESVQIDAIKAQYGPLIAEQQTKVNDIQAKIDQSDSRFMEQAKEQEKILNNQQRVFELEKQKVVDIYEEKLRNMEASYTNEIESIKENNEKKLAQLRRQKDAEIRRQFKLYNPSFKDRSAEIIAGYNPDTYEIDDKVLFPFQKIYEDENIYSESDLDDRYESFSKMQAILGQLQEVPYENSLPPAFTFLQAEGLEIVGDYERQVYQAGKTLQKKTDLIAKLEKAQSRLLFGLEQYAQTQRESGFIIDARDPEKILIILNSLLPEPESQEAWIFRKNDVLIGKVEIWREDDSDWAKVISLTNPEQPIQSFDKVVVQVEQ
ncbi:MAG: hypothetical protein PQJ46_00430 [Spirochaetales bacterium]|nr:hypothetical protein [Spirochaetales bacterium]